MSGTSVILTLIVFIAIAVAIYYLYESRKIAKDSSNVDMIQATRWLDWGLGVAILGSLACFVLFVLYFIFFSATVAATGNAFSFIMLILLLLILLAIGVFAAKAAEKINSSTDEGTDKAYEDAIIASILGIVGFVVVLIAIVYQKASHKKSVPVIVNSEGVEMTQIKQE